MRAARAHPFLGFWNARALPGGRGGFLRPLRDWGRRGNYRPPLVCDSHEFSTAGLDLSTVADDDPATISSKEQEQQQGQGQEQQQQSSCQYYIYMHQLRGHKFPEGSVSPPDSASSLRGERAGGRAIPSSPGMGMGAKSLSALCAGHFQLINAVSACCACRPGSPNPPPRRLGRRATGDHGMGAALSLR